MQFNISDLPPWAKLEVSKEDLESFAKTIAFSMKGELQPLAPSAEQQIIWMDDAAKLLNLAKQTIYGLISKGKLPYYKRGRKVYFLRTELETWLLTGKQKTMADEEQSINEYLSKRNNKKA